MESDDEIAVGERDGSLVVRTPYDERFVRSAKRLGGRWSPAERCWFFDPKLRRRVDSVIRRVFGGADRAAARTTEEPNRSVGDDLAREAERFLRSQA